MDPLGGHVALRNLNLSPFAIQEYCPYGTQPSWRYRGLPLFTLCVNISGKNPLCKKIQVWEELHSATCYFQR